jgi:hypothetical protein
MPQGGSAAAVRVSCTEAQNVSAGRFDSSAVHSALDKLARRVHLNSMLTVLNDALHPTPATEIQVAGSPTSVGGKIGVLCNVEVSEGPA